MLNLLYSKINKVVPIIGLQTDNNGFIVEYEQPASITNEQLAIVNNIIQGWPIELAKISKMKQLDLWWELVIKNGFQTSYGWKLGLKIEDVTLLTGAFLLAKEAMNLGLSQESMVMDTEGVSHMMTIGELTTLMLQYGQYRSHLSLNYSDKKIQIENCTSIEQIEKINI